MQFYRRTVFLALALFFLTVPQTAYALSPVANPTITDLFVKNETLYGVNRWVLTDNPRVAWAGYATEDLEHWKAFTPLQRVDLSSALELSFDEYSAEFCLETTCFRTRKESDPERLSVERRTVNAQDWQVTWSRDYTDYALKELSTRHERTLGRSPFSYSDISNHLFIGTPVAFSKDGLSSIVIPLGAEGVLLQQPDGSWEIQSVHELYPAPDFARSVSEAIHVRINNLTLSLLLVFLSMTPITLSVIHKSWASISNDTKLLLRPFMPVLAAVLGAAFLLSLILSSGQTLSVLFLGLIYVPAFILLVLPTTAGAIALVVICTTILIVFGRSKFHVAYCLTAFAIVPIIMLPTIALAFGTYLAPALTASTILMLAITWGWVNVLIRRRAVS